MFITSTVQKEKPIYTALSIQEYTESQLDNWGKWSRESNDSIVSHNENLANKAVVLVYNVDDAITVENYVLELGLYCPRAFKAIKHVYLKDRTNHMGATRMNVSRNTFRLYRVSGESFIGSKLQEKYLKIIVDR